MIVPYLLYAGVGRVLIYLFQKVYADLLSGFFKGRSKEYLDKFFGCDLCFGFWVYFFLSVVFQDANVDVYIIDAIHAPIISAIITGAVTTFLVHLVVIGWRDKFSTFVIGE